MLTLFQELVSFARGWGWRRGLMFNALIVKLRYNLHNMK